ncbi:MAG: NADP-dependent phosphogluconate dehydrogenase, partial [Lachnospiraceae bacterium]|nr:NADP-dependent phosphogluconate dehydrogenase [Lachnospiraceae bacterium]
HLMKENLGMSEGEISQVFKEWNEGELQSYLIEITSIILKKKENDGSYLVDHILDVAGQKGTGKWTGQISLDLGIPIPTITSAVYERYLSSYKEERYSASKILTGPAKGKGNLTVDKIRRALYASKICVYAQGFDMLLKASEQYNWNLNCGEISKIFRGGCIIRAGFLNQIAAAYHKNTSLYNLLLDPFFSHVIKEYENDWRSVISDAVLNGTAVPAFSSAIAYYDSYRNMKMPTGLIQAQRDYFGAHTYKRIDREGTFHTEWNEA